MHRFPALQVKKDALALPKEIAARDAAIKRHSSPPSAKLHKRRMEHLPASWCLKIRGCDDARANFVNMASHSDSAISVQTVDKSIAHATYMARCLRANNVPEPEALAAAVKDQGDAYRSVRSLECSAESQERDFLPEDEGTAVVRCVLARPPRDRCEGPTKGAADPIPGLETVKFLRERGEELVEGFEFGRCSYGETNSVILYNSSSRLCSDVSNSCGLPTDHYYDDFKSWAWAAHMSTLSFIWDYLWVVIALCNFNPKKTQHMLPGGSVLYLEVQFSIRGSQLLLQLSQERKQKVLYYVLSHLASNLMTCGQAKSLAGCLTWAGSSLLGRCGRSQTAAIGCRGAQRYTRGRTSTMNGAIRGNLEWWKRLMTTGVTDFRRQVNLLPTAAAIAASYRPVLTWSDACLFGKGLVVAIPSGSAHYTLCWASQAVSGEEFRKRMDKVKNHPQEAKDLMQVFGISRSEVDSLLSSEEGRQQAAIATLELEIVEEVYAPKHQRCLGVECGRDICHFIDNNNAMSCLLRGCSGGASLGKRLSARAASVWERCARVGCNVWWARVCSLDNPSDPPSRGLPPAWDIITKALCDGGFTWDIRKYDLGRAEFV